MTKRAIRAVAAAALVLSMGLTPSGVTAQSNQSARPSASAGCQAFSVPIYHLGGHYIPQARFEACPGGVIADITPAPNGLRAGEITILSMGRFQNKQVPFLLRGTPNTPYLFRAVYLHDLAGQFLYDQAAHPLTGLAHALPFQPKQIVSLGDLGDGHVGYGYTELEILPSHARDAYPLTRQSVVIAIDGFNFVTPQALPSYLAAFAPQERANPYVEVVYFQMDDKVQTLRRALIPLYRRTSVEPEWSKIAAGNHAFDEDRSRGVKAVLMVIAIAGIVEAFSQTKMGQQMIKDYHDCQNRQAGTDQMLFC